MKWIKCRGRHTGWMIDKYRDAQIHPCWPISDDNRWEIVRPGHFILCMDSFEEARSFVERRFSATSIPLATDG